MKAFDGIDYALLLGGVPRRPGMVKETLLKANARIFKSHGMYLDRFAKKTVKVLVVGKRAEWR